MLRHDLHQRLQQRVALPVVASLVRVRNHHHVVGIVVVAQALVERRKPAVFLRRNALAVVRRAEQHVVVAALDVLDRPFVAEERHEAAVLVRGGRPRQARRAGEPAHVLAQHVPLEIVHPDVVFGVRHVVQPGIVARPDHEPLRRAHPFGETGMPVGVAPVDAARRRGFHQHRIRHPHDVASLGAKREATHAGRIEPHVVQNDDGVVAGRNLAERLAVHRHLPRRNRPRRPVVEAVLGAHRNRERLPHRHHRRREAVNARHFAADHHDGLDGQAHRLERAVEVDVERQRHAVAGEARQQQPAPAPGGVAVGDGHHVTGSQMPGDDAEHQRVLGAAEAAVHAAHRRGRAGEAHGGVGRRDGDVVVACLVVGLEGDAGHEVAGDHEAAPRFDVLRAHGVGLANRHMAAHLERAGIRNEPADGVRLVVEQRHLANGRVEARGAASVGGIGQGAGRRLGRVHRHVAPGERVGVDPVPQGLRPRHGVGAVARNLRHGRLQRLHPSPQFRRQIVVFGSERRPVREDAKHQRKASPKPPHAATLCSTSDSKASMRLSSRFSVARQKSGSARSTSKCLAAKSSAVIRPVSRSSAS